MWNDFSETIYTGNNLQKNIKWQTHFKIKRCMPNVCLYFSMWSRYYKDVFFIGKLPTLVAKNLPMLFLYMTDMLNGQTDLAASSIFIWSYVTDILHYHHYWSFIQSVPLYWTQFPQSLASRSYRWFSERLQQLQCVSNGVTAVLH